MGDHDDEVWKAVQRLYALAELLKRWDGKPFDNDVLVGLGLLLEDIATQLQV